MLSVGSRGDINHLSQGQFVFDDALKTASDTPPKLLDIAQIVAQGIAD
jgi:hypothetical protein